MQAPSLTQASDQYDALVSPSRKEHRQSLREFQQQLVERAQRARSGKNSEPMRLAARAGDQQLLLDIAHTAEVIPYEGVKPVPHTVPWFLGLINCRGRITAVMDFSGFLGHPVKPLQDSDRLLVLSDALEAPCALRVSRVMGLVSLCDFSPQSKSADEPAWVRSVFVDRESSTWRLLDLPLLMGDAKFLDVAAA